MCLIVCVWKVYHVAAALEKRVCNREGSLRFRLRLRWGRQLKNLHATNFPLGQCWQRRPKYLGSWAAARAGHNVIEYAKNSLIFFLHIITRMPDQPLTICCRPSAQKLLRYRYRYTNTVADADTSMSEQRGASNQFFDFHATRIALP